MASQDQNTFLAKEDFRLIANLAYNESGLQLVEEKSSMIQSRLRHRLKALGINDFSAYANYVCSDAGMSERRLMISALTTNVSHFFREHHHFEILSQELEEKFSSLTRGGEKIRIWSAGCSNGQEPISILISAFEKYPQIRDMDFKILATDIDPIVVEFASRAEYPERQLSGVSEAYVDKYFNMVDGDGERTFKLKGEFLDFIAYRELNLLKKWPMRLQMDFIFCRNVVIYFDQATQDHLWPRFFEQLKNGGLLFLGHSERVSRPDEIGFSSCGPTAYRARWGV